MQNLYSTEIISEESLTALVRRELLTLKPEFSNVGIGVNTTRDAFGFVRNYHIYLKTAEGRNLTGRLRTLEDKDVNNKIKLILMRDL